MLSPDISLHPGGTELTLDIAEKAGLKAGDRLLDIGCGTGSSLAALARRFGIVPFGADISETALGIARRAVPNADLICADAAALPYPDRSFDAVLMECVVTLLEDPEAALSEAERVLKPGGKLLLSALSAEASMPGCSGRIAAGGLLQPDAFRAFVTAHGFSVLSEEDRKKELKSFVAESIFVYGSLEERIKSESSSVGAAALDCGLEYDPKTTGYGSWILLKQLEDVL
ncbi:MAG: class I SAM-dependent methyltransferase [Firmicutes bacterium]|nr:class I SAM-dependent methyltransferase [Bacillota bacterium]